jgi:crotonobetainyl-CoA:carnitine CoA-transferase CaiB-like acyl-CoA transferase
VPYHRVDDLFDDPHLDDVGFWEQVEHPTEGTLLQVSTPFTYDGERLRLGTPAPQLGADTAAVLDALD